MNSIDMTVQVDWYKIMALPNYEFQTPMSEVDPKRCVSRRQRLLVT